MMKFITKLGIVILLATTFQSCKPDDIYYNLSSDAKNFLLFDVDDTFKLKNLETNEIITLTVTSKNINHYEDGPNESPFISFGPSGDIYIERGEYFFTDNTNCYNGAATVVANQDGGFEFKIYLGNCFGDYNFTFDYTNEFLPAIDVEGVEYSNAHLLRCTSDIIYYSKQKGILKIMDEYSQVTKFVIVE